MSQEPGKTIQTQLVVIGGGPAGLAAAVTAAELGVKCLLIERYDRLGGQITAGYAHHLKVRGNFSEPEIEEIQSFQSRLQALDIITTLESHLWSITPDRCLNLLGEDGNSQVHFDTLIVASGAFERPMPFKGWTLPGVITAGAAQRLVVQGVPPGERVLVAGRGPLLMKCAAQLSAAGIQVVALIEATPFSHLLKNGLQRLAHFGEKLGQAFDYQMNLIKSRVPILYGHALIEASGLGVVEKAVTIKLGKDGKPLEGQERSWHVDAICISNGLEPSTRISRMLGCKHFYDPLTQAYIPQHDQRMRTSLGWLLVAGEAAGLGGAAKALVEGQIAGLQSAISMQCASEESLSSRLKRLEVRHEKVLKQAEAVERSYVRSSSLLDLCQPETPICRCEQVSRATLRQAIQSGSVSLRDLKNQTRIGMGLCQGHFCEAMLTHEFMLETGEALAPEDLLRIRPPLEPLPLNLLIE